ncbi:MAG TPA: tetratricopeptide repeat protein [Capsulimonadaceae bacterium]|jgi:hypothetical protein
MIDTPEQLGSDVKRILAAANLHRMRGRWHAAAEACMDALCIEPDNVSAHSLMGDIYVDQGRLDDAIQWYCLTLDLAPDSQSDRVKLTRIVDERKRQIAEKPPQLNMRLVKSAFRIRRENVNRTQFWRSERPVKISIFIAAVLCLSAVVAWPIITARNGQVVAPGQTAKHIDTNPIFLSPFTSEPTATTSSQALTSLVTDPSDHALLVKLRADQELLGRSIVVTEVSTDPRASKITIGYLSNPVAGVAVTRGQIVRNAIKLAQSALASSQPPQPLVFTMRGLMSSDKATAPLAFVADINASDLFAINAFDPTRSDAELEARFISVWWSTAIPASSGPRAVTGIAQPSGQQVQGPAIPHTDPIATSTPAQSPAATPTPTLATPRALGGSTGVTTSR